MRALANSQVLNKELGSKPFGKLLPNGRFEAPQSAVSARTKEQAGQVAFREQSMSAAKALATHRLQWVIEHAPFGIGYMPGMEVRIHFMQDYSNSENRGLAVLQIALVPLYNMEHGG
jgi:hypothetical protein